MFFLLVSLTLFSCSITKGISQLKSTHIIKEKILFDVIEDAKVKNHISGDSLNNMIISVVCQNKNEVKINILPLSSLTDTYNNDFVGYSFYKDGMIVFWGDKTNNWIEPIKKSKKRKLFTSKKIKKNEIYIPTFATGVEHYFYTYTVYNKKFKLTKVNNSTPDLMISKMLLNYYK